MINKSIPEYLKRNVTVRRSRSFRNMISRCMRNIYRGSVATYDIVKEASKNVIKNGRYIHKNIRNFSYGCAIVATLLPVWSICQGSLSGSRDTKIISPYSNEKKINPFYAVGVFTVPGSSDENTWSEPSVPANIGPNTHQSADDDAIINILDVNYRPFNGTYSILATVYHPSGIDHVGSIQDNGSEIDNDTLVLGLDNSGYRQDCKDRWVDGIIIFDVRSSDLSGYSGGKRLTKLWLRAYPVDGQPVQVSIILEAHSSAIAPTEYRYVAKTTNSPFDSNDGSNAHPYATLGKAMEEIADGGEIVLLDEGIYDDDSSGRSVNNNTRFITISTPNDRDTVEVRSGSPKTFLYHLKGVSLCPPNFGQFNPVENGIVWLDDVLWTGPGRHLNTAGPGQFHPVNLDFGYTFFCQDCDAYDVVWGFFSNGTILRDCTATKLSGIPASGGVWFNFYCDDFTTEWTNPANNPGGASPDPTPIGGSPGAYTSTLNGGVNNSTTTWIVTTPNGSGGVSVGLPGATNGPTESYPYYLKVGTEVVKVTARSGSTLTVVRAQRSTSASTHADGSAITSEDSTYHPDIWHTFGPISNVSVYGLRFGDNVVGTCFRIERGAVTNIAFLNCDITEIPSGNSADPVNGGGVGSDLSNVFTNITWRNVYIPQNFFTFTADVGAAPDLPFDGTNVYFVDCGLNWRNGLPWIAGISTTGSSGLADGVIIQNCYIPPDGTQSNAINTLAGANTTDSLDLSWSASGWSSRNSGTLYVYDDSWSLITSVGVSVSGTYSDTNIGSDETRNYIIIESNSGTGEERFSNIITGTHDTNYVPSSPTGATAIGEDSAIALQWNTTSGATSYIVTRKYPGDLAFSLLATVNTPTITYLDEDVINDEGPVFYQVQASNATGTSLPSAMQATASASETGPRTPKSISGIVFLNCTDLFKMFKNSGSGPSDRAAITDALHHGVSADGGVTFTFSSMSLEALTLSDDSIVPAAYGGPASKVTWTQVSISAVWFFWAYVVGTGTGQSGGPYGGMGGEASDGWIEEDSGSNTTVIIGSNAAAEVQFATLRINGVSGAATRSAAKKTVPSVYNFIMTSGNKNIQADTPQTNLSPQRGADRYLLGIAYAPSSLFTDSSDITNEIKSIMENYASRVFKTPTTASITASVGGL